MAKYLVGVAIGDTPTYDASQQKITFDSATFKDKYSTSPIEFIINNTTNELIYKEGLTGKGGTWDSANHALTLEFDTTADGSTDSDSLTIWADIKDGKRGVDFLSQMYVEGIANAQNDDVEGKLVAVEAKLETMRSEQNTKLDKLAEVPDVTLIDTKTGTPAAKDVVIVDPGGGAQKEAHVVAKDVVPSAGAATKVADADLIVTVKGIDQVTTDITIKEGATVKVDAYPLAQSDSIDARADRVQVAAGGKVQVTLVKE